MEWVKTTAKTVPQAIEMALDNLGVDESEAEIVVIEEPRTGLFGRTKGAARVEARIKPVTVRPKADRRNRRGDRKSKRGNSRGRSNDRGGRNKNGNRGDGNNNKGDGNRSGNGQNNRGRNGGNKSQDNNRSGGQGNQQGQGRGGQGGRSRTRSNNRADGNAGDERANVNADTGSGDSDSGESGSSGKRRRGGRGKGGGQGTAAAAATAGAAASGAATSRNNQKSGDKPRNLSKPPKEETPVEHVDDEVVEAHLMSFLGGLATAFGVEDSVSVEQPEPGVMEVMVAGQHGLMVGPKGRTLDAIQELARVSSQRSAPSAVRIRVDVGGYRQQRSEAIAGFARKAADKAVDNGVEVKLDPMPAADRKSVHDALTEDDRVETRSIGNEPRRRVLIVPLESGTGSDSEEE